MEKSEEVVDYPAPSPRMQVDTTGLKYEKRELGAKPNSI